MDWMSFIQSILPFILGGGLVAIFTVPAAVKKAKIENESLAIGPLQTTISLLHEEIRRKEARIQELEAEREETDQKHAEKLNSCVEKYENKCEESATAKSMMCVHLGCSLRDPLLGQGDAWLETHREDISLGVDYTPVNVLMKRLGQKRKVENNDTGQERDNQGA